MLLKYFEIYIFFNFKNVDFLIFLKIQSKKLLKSRLGNLHFLILQISGLNLIASGHYDFVNVCIILLSRIEKIHREAAEKMLFLRSKKHENQRFFGLFFWYQWYQYEVGINVRV